MPHLKKPRLLQQHRYQPTAPHRMAPVRRRPTWKGQPVTKRLLVHARIVTVISLATPKAV